MIKAATQSLEAYCDQKFISQTWSQFMDNWPSGSAYEPWWDGVRELPVSILNGCGGHIEILTGPIQSVTEFNTYADDGVANLFPSSSYIVDNSGPFGRVALPLGGVWPTTILRKLNGIEIKFIAGVAINAASTPSDIKQAVLEYVAQMYENRGDLEISKIPKTSMSLLLPYVRIKAGGKFVV